ncbi:hypothetical protein BH09VER1_BH09VER1_16210 [soil metagenome]
MAKSALIASYPKVPDIAKKFNVHIRTVWDWVYRGIIPHYRMGRSVYFKWEDIEQHMNENRYCGYQRLPAQAVIQTPQGPIPAQEEMPFEGKGIAANSPFIKIH